MYDSAIEKLKSEGEGIIQMGGVIDLQLHCKGYGSKEPLLVELMNVIMDNIDNLNLSFT